MEITNAAMDEMKWASRKPARYGPIFRATVNPATPKLVARGRIQRAISGRRKLDTIGGAGFAELRYEAMNAVNQRTNPVASPAIWANRPSWSSVFAHRSLSNPPSWRSRHRAMYDRSCFGVGDGGGRAEGSRGADFFVVGGGARFRAIGGTGRPGRKGPIRMR